jgi:hypothetical protein
MSLIGVGAIGRIAIGQEIDAPFTTAILVAASGSIALTGEPATFQTREVAAQGSFTLTGKAVAFQAQLSAAFGAFTLTGEAAAF